VTGSLRRKGPRHDQHGVPGALDPVDMQASQMREERRAAGTLASQQMQTMTLAAAR
jgi:hypothetical protein